MHTKNIQLDNTMNWLTPKGKENSIIISSRARIARNFADVPFPRHASAKQHEEVRKRVNDVVDMLPELKSASARYHYYELDPVTRRVLVERNLVPKRHAGANALFLIIDKNEKYSILVNEEDHLRIQVIMNGLEMKRAYRKASALEMKLEEKTSFAFDADYGYHTASPANVGTGLRVSFMAHVPVLMDLYDERLKKLMLYIHQNGGDIRGTKGDTSKSVGNLVQIVNQITLGLTEDEILARMMKIAKRVLREEKRVRERFYSKNKSLMEDRVYRSLNILRSARFMGYTEMLALLSWVRVGVDLKIYDVPLSILNTMLFSLQSAHIVKRMGDKYKNGFFRDEVRAMLVRNMLSDFTFC